MATPEELAANDRYQRQQSRMEQEDGKNMAIARQIGGWGTGMTGAPSTGETPYGVPGMGIPKSYGAVEEALTGAITSPVAAIPRGESDIERAMKSTTTGVSPTAGIPERLTSRTTAIIDRLGGKLRRSTRANLTNELNAIMGTLTTLTGQETTRGMKQAELQEGRATSAIPGLGALTGMRKQALEEAITPWEMATKQMTAEANAARDRAAAGLAGVETEKGRREVAIMPETVQQAIKIHRQMTKPFSNATTAIDEEKVHESFRKAAIEDAKNASAPGKPASPDFNKAYTDAEVYIGKMQGKRAQHDALTSPAKYARYMKSKGSQLSPEDLETIYHQKGYDQYTVEEE